MTNDEALSKLELEQGATSSEINTQYQEFYNEFQMRITNAPTEHQRKLYQKKLEELAAAFEVLGGENPESNTQELPGISESEIIDTEKRNNSSAPIKNNFDSEEQIKINKASAGAENMLLRDALDLLGVQENFSPVQIKKAYLTQKAELETEMQKIKVEAAKQVYRQELEKLSKAWLVVELWIQNRMYQEDNFHTKPLKEKKEFIKDLKKNKYLILGLTSIVVFGISYIAVWGSQPDSTNEKQLSKSYTEKEGTFKTSQKYERIGYFKDGMACVVLNEKFGFIDEKGKEVIPLIYEFNQRLEQLGHQYIFCSGLAPVSLKGKFGYINKAGKLIIPNIYDWAFPFNEEGKTVVGIGDKKWVIDKKGNKLNLDPDEIKYAYDVNYDDYPEKQYFDNDKYGYCDKKGNIIIYPIYEMVFPFYKGIAAVELNGKVGFINAKGKQVVPFKYMPVDFDGFYEGLWRVAEDGKGYGFVNDKGKEVITCKYDESHVFLDGLCPVAKDGKWGYIDKTEKVVIPLKFGSANPFANNAKLTLVEYKGRRYFIDKKGKLIIDCQ